MFKLLPVVLVVLLVLGGLIYFRYFAASKDVVSPEVQSSTQVAEAPIEVPKTLPNDSLEDRVQTLEEAITKIINKVNTSTSSPSTDNTLSSRLNSVEAAVTELKARVSSLENATPEPQAAAVKSPLYIPLGTGGSSSNNGWVNLAGYEVSLDPAEYSGYSSIQLEVTMRLLAPGGNAMAKLLNSTDNSVVSSEISTSSTSYTLVSSAGFRIASGKKTYRLQVKSSESVEMFVQSARLKVNF